MHRVRVGLIGLSCVFLLVALAAALLRVAGSEEVVNGSGVEALADNVTAPTEPLAQLGVVPGNAPPDASPAPPRSAAAPARR